ncbi:MAG: hypothetical protein E7321_00155 [Clostridiales bacterium]|nr:hypothetical protein [Clostridiales bacterium]
MTERGKAFQTVRAQVLLIRGLKNQLHKAMTENEKKYFDNKLRAETQRMIRVEKEARKHMDSMKPEQYAFCAMYYLNAMSLETAAESLNRSVRQCARYKKRIENE